MRIISFLFLFFVAGYTSPAFAQNQKEHKKGSYVDSLNRYFQHVDLPVYLHISTTPDATNAVPLKEISNKDKEIKPIYLDGPGMHHLKHMDAIHHKIDVFHVYGDNKAPVSALKPSNSPSFKNKSGKLFYGTNLSISLSSTDDMSGVKQVYISINGEEYREYAEKEIFTKEGDYTIKYYAVDNVGNTETPKIYTFTVDLSSPKTFHNVIGIASGSVVSMASRIYLDKEDSGAGIKMTYYTFDDEEYKPLTGREITFKHLNNGDHTLHYWSVDEVKNTEEKQSFSFFLDKIAPISAMDILGDKFIVNDKIYFSGRTKVKLTAVDNRTGVKELKYSMNNSVYQDYDEPFYMPNKAGLYTIKFYAVDDTGNRSDGENMHSRGVIYVDLSGPILNYKLEGPTFMKGNLIYVGAKTKFSISAKDLESGLQYLAYTINDGEENKYTSPFAIANTSGEYIITYIAYDNVNNRNQDKVKLMLDVEGPVINSRFSAEAEKNTSGEDVYPSYIQLFISATDASTTAAEILYSIDGGKELPYLAPLKGFVPNKKYIIKVKAKDALDNESISEINFQTGDY